MMLDTDPETGTQDLGFTSPIQFFSWTWQKGPVFLLSPPTAGTIWCTWVRIHWIAPTPECDTRRTWQTFCSFATYFSNHCDVGRCRYLPLNPNMDNSNSQKKVVSPVESHVLICLLNSKIPWIWKNFTWWLLRLRIKLEVGRWTQKCDKAARRDAMPPSILVWRQIWSPGSLPVSTSKRRDSDINSNTAENARILYCFIKHSALLEDKSRVHTPHRHPPLRIMEICLEDSWRQCESGTLSRTGTWSGCHLTRLTPQY